MSYFVRLPQDAYNIVASFLTEHEAHYELPAVCRATHHLADQQIQEIITVIHGDPAARRKGMSQLSFFIQNASACKVAQTAIQKLNVVRRAFDEFDHNPGMELSKWLYLESKATDQKIFEYARASGDLELMRWVNPQFFSPYFIRDQFLKTVKVDDLLTLSEISQYDQIKDRASMWGAALKEEGIAPACAKFLLTKKPTLEIDEALTNAVRKNDLPLIEILLQNGLRRMSFADFDIDAGLNSPFARENGVHANLVLALDHNYFAAFQRLLTVRPSRQILEHVRARANWINAQLELPVNERFTDQGEGEYEIHKRDMTDRASSRAPFIDLIDSALAILPANP